MNQHSHKPLAQRQDQRTSISLFALLLLCALLLLPAFAGLRLAQSFGSHVIAGWVALMSAASFGLCWHDKRRAQAGGWRTPESTLHLFELFGGWPASFLAQRLFRHKISKRSYQAEFWAIIAAHQVAAFDYLHDWQYLNWAIGLLQAS